MLFLLCHYAVNRCDTFFAFIFAVLLPILVTEQAWLVNRRTVTEPKLKKIHFYRAMLRRARYCYGKSSVCLPVRPSVRLCVRNVEAQYKKTLRVLLYCDAASLGFLAIARLSCYLRGRCNLLFHELIPNTWDDRFIDVSPLCQLVSK